MAEPRQGGYVPPAPGRRVRARLHRGEYVLPVSQAGRRARALDERPERPERDEREIAAEVSRPEEPGGEAR